MESWDKYSEEIQEFIQKYGIQELEKLINAIRPLMPFFV